VPPAGTLPPWPVIVPAATVEEIPNFAVLRTGLMLADVFRSARMVITESGKALYAKKPVAFVIVLASLRNKIACMTILLGLW
jgi:hypothetical protein